MLLVEGAGGFLHTVFVVFHLFFDLLDSFRVAKPALNAVKSFGVDTTVHQDIVILDVGDTGSFDARLLLDSGSSEEDEGEHRDEHGEIDLPRFLGDADGLFNLLHRRIGGEVVNLIGDFSLQVID